MKTIIIGNIFAFLASIFMVISSSSKKKKNVLLLQSIQMFLFIISNLILGGLTGIFINILGITRNIISYKDKMNNYLMIILVSLMVIISIIFNNLGIIGLLPVIGTVIYSIYMENKNIKLFKLSLLFSILMWLIYDLYIKSYSSAVFDFLSMITCTISIFKIYRSENK